MTTKKKRSSPSLSVLARAAHRRAARKLAGSAKDPRPLSDRASVDICTCGHSRTRHDGLMGHADCLDCETCGRFTWSHFAEV